MALITLGLAAASATLMAVLYHPGFDSPRVYDGTDTRAFGVLLGAALALVWPSRHLSPNVSAGARRILDGLGVAGLTVIAILIWRTNDYSPFLYQGGMVLLSVATLFVIAAIVHPATRLGPVLGWKPLRWIGVRSYGIYLWMFPIIVLTTPTVTSGVDPLRAALQVAASIGVAALSWRFIEEPIRHGALGRLWERIRAGTWRPRALPRQVRIAIGVAMATLLLASVGLAGAAPPTHMGFLTAQDSSADAQAALSGGTIVRTTTATTPPAGTAPSHGTSCTRVVHR